MDAHSCTCTAEYLCAPCRDRMDGDAIDRSYAPLAEAIESVREAYGYEDENVRFLRLQAQIQEENRRFVTLAEYMRERAAAPKGVR